MFYLSRLLIIGVSIYLQTVLVKAALAAYNTAEEIPWILIGVAGGCLVVSLLVLLFRLSVVFLVGLPLAGLSGLLLILLLFPLEANQQRLFTTTFF